MKFLLILLMLVSPLAHAVGCTQTVGGLTLRVTQPRDTAISPALLFFDATTTTSTALAGKGAGNAIQDIYYAWDFGDGGAFSGAGSWSYGADGQKSKNHASGHVAAHLYIATIQGLHLNVRTWAYDGTWIATCTSTVTVPFAMGVNGFATTTCVAHNSLPVAGSGGCPTGASVYNSTAGTLADAFGSNRLANNKRVLLRCGDTFTGGYNIANTLSTASIGAYGSPDCSNTTSNRPILTGQLTLQDPSNNPTNQPVPTDIRIADLDLEPGSTATALWTSWCGGCFPNVTNGVKQFTLYNVNCSGANQCFGLAAMTESGFIQTTATCAGAGSTGPQCVFPNFGENECLPAFGGMNSTTLFCGAGSYDSTRFTPISYNAFIGNSFNGNGMGGGSGGRETFRVSACRFCVLTNNTFSNANTVGAVFKFHDGNTFGSSATWVGQYLEYNVITDNIFTGTSGTNKAEIGGQNDVTDERARFNIFERNLVQGLSGANTGATKVFVDTANSSFRNNVIFVGSAATGLSDTQFMVSRRCNNATCPSWAITGVELYNNTCYSQLSTLSTCIGFIKNTGEQANQGGSNSFAQNTLFYRGSTGGTVVSNSCASPGCQGNTVNSNTTDTSVSPNMKNGSGAFNKMSDFAARAANTGALSTVPNYFDCYQFSWIGSYRLGACSPVTP